MTADGYGLADALAYAKRYPMVGNEPESQAALTLLAQTVVRRLDDLADVPPPAPLPDSAPADQHVPRLVIFSDVAGGFRFRFLAGNGEVIAQSEAYTRERDAVRGAQRLRVLAPLARIINPEGAEL